MNFTIPDRQYLSWLVEVRGAQHVQVEAPGVPVGCKRCWIGYRILRQTVTLAADGNSFTGTWKIDRTDTNGNIVSHIDADIAGTSVEVDYWSTTEGGKGAESISMRGSLRRRFGAIR